MQYKIDAVQGLHDFIRQVAAAAGAVGVGNQSDFHWVY